jgi:ribonucleoside-triphosphate reductase (formate)
MVQTKCEIYSRVVGYIRPVEQWHEGKQAEFSDRKKFDMSEKINNQTKILGGIKNE